jgi:hypothetical protein
MPSETPEEQIARCLAVMGKEPEELADYVARHTALKNVDDPWAVNGVRPKDRSPK